MSGVQGGKRVHLPSRKAHARPAVSIVTVVFNGAGTIEATIRSVLEQGYPDLEYIIVDGGSTDGTIEVIRRYEDELEYWVSEKDSGIYDAMNKAVGFCRGEWVGLINADDAYTADAIRTAMTAVEGRPDINIVHGDILVRYPNGSIKTKHARPSTFLLKYWEMVLNHPSFFVRRSYYATHPFNTSFKVSGDHHWTLRAWLEDPSQFLYVPLPLAYFAAGGASMTNSIWRMLAEGDRIGRDLGFGLAGRMTGRLVRIFLYLPSIAKLWFNEWVPSLLRKEK
jgi:glycosyltransferase involved in cell wall biosynthesis